jgi:hypothetical protein
MKSKGVFFAVIVLALAVFNAPAAFAGDLCSRLTEAEVSAAVGTQLQRSPTDPCRFGRGFKSIYITMHEGGGGQFDNYAGQARKEFPDVQVVPGIGSKAVFFGFNLAVQYKSDLFVVNVMLGKGTPEKIALAKAVAQKVISHL